MIRHLPKSRCFASECCLKPAAMQAQGKGRALQPPLLTVASALVAALYAQCSSAETPVRGPVIGPTHGLVSPHTNEGERRSATLADGNRFWSGAGILPRQGGGTGFTCLYTFARASTQLRQTSDAGIRPPASYEILSAMIARCASALSIAPIGAVSTDGAWPTHHWQ